MEIFITSSKYNTLQLREDGKPLLVSQLPTLTIVSNVFMRNGTYPFLFAGRVYNKVF